MNIAHETAKETQTKENVFWLYIETHCVFFFPHKLDRFILSGLGLKSLESKQVFLLISRDFRLGEAINGNSE